MLATILKDDTTLAGYKTKAVPQVSMGKTTRAPLFKGSFGEIHFLELEASAV